MFGNKFFFSRTAGRYVRAPKPESDQENDEDSEMFNGNFGNSTFSDSVKLGFPMPKLPKLVEKSSAHEQLTEWKKYKRSIEFYFNLIKRKLSAQAKLELLYLGGGTEVMKALERFELPPNVDDQAAYEQMIAHMDRHFQTGVDGLAYMLQLLAMIQKEEEPFADFVKRLKAQADLCNLGESRDNLLKAQIQKGAKNNKLFSRADSWVNKSLDDLVGLGIADEASSSNKGKMSSQSESNENIARVTNDQHDHRSNSYRFPRSMRRPSGRPPGRPSFSNHGSNNSYRGAQSSRQYPYSSGNSSGQASARSQIQCWNCQKTGHVSRNCRASRNVFYNESRDEQVQNEIFE